MRRTTSAASSSTSQCSAFHPQIAVNDSAGQVLAAHAFGFEHGVDFPAGVAGVKLVHNVTEKG